MELGPLPIKRWAGKLISLLGYGPGHVLCGSELSFIFTTSGYNFFLIFCLNNIKKIFIMLKGFFFLFFVGQSR